MRFVIVVKRILVVVWQKEIKIAGKKRHIAFDVPFYYTNPKQISTTSATITTSAEIIKP